MFTGKRPTDEMFTDSLNLHNFSKMAIVEPLTGMINPLIFQQAEELEANMSNTSNGDNNNNRKMNECLMLVLRIGIDCSLEIPSARMDISDVIPKLNVARDILLQDGGIEEEEL
ncbi:hypothetical protein LguiB_015335 [Lonicera macranthoides]